MPKKEKKNKTGSTGRFGARYGTRVRQRVRSIEDRMRGKHECPNCEAKKVQRVSSGVWECQRCETKFTAKAYSPETTSVEKRIFSEEGEAEEILEEEEEK